MPSLSKLLKGNRLVVYIVVGFLLTGTPVATAQTGVHFGENILLLRTPGDQFLTPVDMTSSGVFIAGIGSQDVETNLHLWEVQTEGDETTLLPLYSEPIDGITDQYIRAAIEFSPSGELLAVGSLYNTRLLSIPELREIQSINENGQDSINGVAWSPDGHLLASLVNGNQVLVVWDTETNNVFRYGLDHPYIGVFYFNDEWLVTAAYIRGYTDWTSAFVMCALRLEQCVTYTYPGMIHAFSSTTPVLVSARYDDAHRGIVGIWRYRPDGAYVIDENLPAELSHPSSLSPDGRYLIAVTEGDSTGQFIWDTNTFEIVQRPTGQSWAAPVWITNELFVTKGYPEFLSLALYRIGQDNPVDTIDLSNLEIDITGLVDSESFGVREVSSDGSLLLVSLGYANLLVPIVYE